MEGQGGTRAWARARTCAPPLVVLATLALVVLAAGACGRGDDPRVAVAPGSSTTEAEHAPAPLSQLATIHGVVSRGGQPAPGARLTLVSDNGSERVATADGSGAYRFTDVAAGHHELVTYAESGKTCDASGCISASWSHRDDLTVAAGETLRFDVNAG